MSDQLLALVDGLELVEHDLDLIPLHKPLDVDQRGRQRGKSPWHDNWPARQYTPDELRAFVRAGHNLGVRIGPGQAVLDIDPRNDAEGRSADQLLNAVESVVGPLDGARVRTGSGGLHVYLAAPAEACLREHAEAFGKAVELKRAGRQVVAPGSTHPDGGTYDALAPGLRFAPAPAPLLAAFERPAVASAPPTQHSPEWVEACLGQLEATDFDSDYPAWRDLLFAAHSATGGSDAGLQAFTEWSTSSPSYRDAAPDIEAMWESASALRPEGVTAAKLAWAVSEAGGEVPADPWRDVALLEAQLAAEAAAAPADEPTSAAPDTLCLELTALAPFDRAQIEKRPWLVPGLLMHGHVTQLFGAAGTAKSILAGHIGAAVAAGIGWAHWRAPAAPCQVLVISNEDDLNEHRRRAHEALAVLGIPQSAVEGRLHLYCTGGTTVLVSRDRSGVTATTPLYDMLRATMLRDKTQLLILDPQIEFFEGVGENDNSGMLACLVRIRELARVTGAAILLVHHTGKGSDGSSGRGASSVPGACRVTVSLTPMSEEEADDILGEQDREKRREYIKLTGVKANYSATGDEAWLHRVLRDYQGEKTPALVAWDPQKAADATFDLVKDEVLRELWLCSRLAVGEKYQRKSGEEAVARYGRVSKRRARQILDAWIASGLVREEPGPNRKLCLAVDEAQVAELNLRLGIFEEVGDDPDGGEGV